MQTKGLSGWFWITTNLPEKQQCVQQYHEGSWDTAPKQNYSRKKGAKHNQCFEQVHNVLQKKLLFLYLKWYYIHIVVL